MATRARWIFRSGLRAAQFALAAASCGFPAPEACELSCGAEGACPGGFECQAQTQLCVPQGTRELCEGSGVGLNQPSGNPPSSSGAGGMSGGSSGSGGAGGVSGVPNAGTGGGAGGALAGAGGQSPASDAGPDPTELRVEVENSVVCAGGRADGRISVSGGVPPYQLRIVENTANLSLEVPPGSDPDDVSLLHLLGSATPGRLIVELEDSTGKVVQSDPIVARERPSVSTLELPIACAGLGYAAPLLAEGGEGELQWSVALHPSSVAQSLADLGLHVQEGRISGELSAELSASSGAFALDVWVRDGQCESDVVELALQLEPEQSEECPAILLQQAPDELPSACLGNVYFEALTAAGGEAPYVWTALAQPPGLHFDAASATLSGVAEGEGELHVQLSDAGGRSVEKTYPLATRDKCWLGYVATERPPARLELVDVFLLARQPQQARRTLALAPSNAAALDFRFAPSGRWLAHRQAQGAQRRLELLRLSDGQAHSLADVTAVDGYSFARDSALLAFSFTRGGQTFLGGLDLSGAEPVVFTPDAELTGVRSLAARAVPLVASALVWDEQRRLAFLTPDLLLPARRRLVTTRHEGDGFASPVVRDELDFSESATLLESALGVFVADPETGRVAFFPAGGGAALVLPSGAFVSPSGAFVARTQAGALQLFRAPDAGGATPLLTAGGCSTLLAWSSEREHLACAGERSDPSSLTFWQAQSAPPELLALGPRRDADVIASPAFAGQRRAFAPSATWFAVGTDEALHVARPDAAARLAFSVPSSLLSARASTLAFAPDERALLVGAANTLAWLDLEQGPTSLRVLSSSALLEEGCREDLLAGYDAWCGGSSVAPNLSWSSNSDAVAFRSALGTLQVVDVRHAREGLVRAPLSPDDACSEACSSASNARFQP